METLETITAILQEEDIHAEIEQRTLLEKGGRKDFGDINCFQGLGFLRLAIRFKQKYEIHYGHPRTLSSFSFKFGGWNFGYSPTGPGAHKCEDGFRMSGAMDLCLKSVQKSWDSYKF